MGIGKIFKKTVKAVTAPFEASINVTKGAIDAVRKGRLSELTDAVREEGRRKIFGIRAREIGVAVAAAYAGYVAYSAYGGTTASGAGSAMAASGGAVGATAIPVVSSTGIGATLASAGKYAALGLALSRTLGILPGPGNPEFAPDTIPSENYFPRGMLGEFYPEYVEGGGVPLSAYDTGQGSYSEGIGGLLGGKSNMIYIAAGGLLLFVIGFVLLRR